MFYLRVISQIHTLTFASRAHTAVRRFWLSFNRWFHWWCGCRAYSVWHTHAIRGSRGSHEWTANGKEMFSKRISRLKGSIWTAVLKLIRILNLRWTQISAACRLINSKYFANEVHSTAVLVLAAEEQCFELILRPTKLTWIQLATLWPRTSIRRTT